MEIQKLIWILLLFILIIRLFVIYFHDHPKWVECPYPIDLWQLVLFSLLSFTVILNIFSLILFRYRVWTRCRTVIAAWVFFLQLLNIILCIVGAVFVGLTLKDDKECVICNQLPVEVYHIIITVVFSLAYWLLTCCVTVMQVYTKQTATFFIPYERFNDADMFDEPAIGLSRLQIDMITQENLKEDTVCSICLENIMMGSVAKVIPRCGHKFHEPCIVPWLISNSICPYCRRSIVFEQKQCTF